MKFAITSDLHGVLPSIDPCDYVCICGDIVPLQIQRNHVKSRNWFNTDFLGWTDLLDCKHIYYIAGNHDFYLENQLNHPEKNLSTDKVTYLDGSKTVETPEGISIYGNPFCHEFGLWAFMRSYELLEHAYKFMPDNLDILLTHDAPNLCGLGTIHQGKYAGEDAGNNVLTEAIIQHKPRYAFCGHIHSGEHNLQTFGKTKLANVSLVNEQYHPVNNILYINI